MKRKILTKHKREILTAISLIGATTTPVLASVDAYKAHRRLEQASAIEYTGNRLNDLKKEFCLVWKDFIPTAISYSITVSVIAMNHKVSTKSIAKAALAAGAGSRLLKEYKQEIVDKFGKEALDNINLDLAKKHKDGVKYAKNATNNLYILDDIDTSVPDKSALFYDSWNDLWFYSNLATVKTAEYYLNRVYALRGSASVEEFYEYLGIDIDEEDLFNYGWGSGPNELDWDWIDFSITKTTEDDGDEYYVIDYACLPDSIEKENNNEI